MKTSNEIKLEDAAVLHYTYAKFLVLTTRCDQCCCKPTREEVKRCFMLEFDRYAFITALTATEEAMMNWYHEHVVWGDKDLKMKLLRKGNSHIRSHDKVHEIPATLSPSLQCICTGDSFEADVFVDC